MILLVALQVLTLLGMIGISVWGMSRIPDGARLQVRAGPTGIDWSNSKKWSLLKTPVIGSLIVVATLMLQEVPFAALGLAVMLIFLLAHLSQVKRAAR